MKVLISVLLVMLSVGAFSITMNPAKKNLVKEMDGVKSTPKAAPTVKPKKQMNEYAEEIEKFVEDGAVLEDEAEKLSKFGKITDSMKEIPASDSALHIRNQAEFQICPGKCGGGNHFRNQTMNTGAVLVEPKEMPWVVSIRRLLLKIGDEKNTKTVFCSGTIINSRNILSAASCFRMKVEGFTDVGAYVTTADLGGDERFGTRQIIKVAGGSVPVTVASRKEGRRGPRFDIALVYLAEDIKLGPYATPVCIGPPGNYDWMASTAVTFAKYSQYKYSLIKSDARVINNQYCSNQSLVNFEHYTLCGVFSYLADVREFYAGHLMVIINGTNYQVGIETASEDVFVQTERNELIEAEMKKYTNVPHFMHFLAKHAVGGTCE